MSNDKRTLVIKWCKATVRLNITNSIAHEIFLGVLQTTSIIIEDQTKIFSCTFMTNELTNVYLCKQYILSSKIMINEKCEKHTFAGYTQSKVTSFEQ